MRLLITGTPGTGKTTLAHGLSAVLGIPIVKVEEFISDYLKWDPELNTNYIIDAEGASKKLNKKLSELNSYIVDTVALDLIDASLIDWCIVLRLDPKVLLNRLMQRGWPWCKVVENVFSEILGVSLSSCISKFSYERVIEVNTTGKSPEQLMEDILMMLSYGKPIINVVDWLEMLDTEFLLKIEGELDSCLKR